MKVPLGNMTHQSFHLFPSTKGDVTLFDDFFASEMEESISPFLTHNSRNYGKHLSLISSLIAIFFWLIAFSLSLTDANQNWINLCLLFTFFFAGTQALIGALEDLFTLTINIDVLMILSAFLALLIGSGKEGALLLVLFAFSGALEERVRGRANKSLRSLTQLAPNKTYVVEENGALTLYSVKAIKPGKKIYVPAGHVIPLDGIVLSGESSLNLVHLTGENKPRFVKKGDEVVAGASNLEGPLTIEVTTTSSDSTIARIVQMVMEAHQRRPKFQRLIDRFSSTYAKIVIFSSLAIAIFSPFLFDIAYTGFKGSIYRAIAVLIAASPCALVIAIPITYLSAISSLAKKGILIKGGTILDALTQCRTFAFDKTGTLTKGELTLIGIHPITPDADLQKAKSFAYSLERGALHPIGQALSTMAEKENIPFLSLTHHRLISGFGIEALYEGLPIAIGNRALILPKLSEEKRLPLTKEIDHYEQKGEISTLLLVGEELFLFRFQDEIRHDMKSMLTQLKEKFHIKLLMLTGDHEASAKKVANALNLDRYFANLRPEDKLDHIDKITKIEKLAMVGDGINDAPSLARATVGISLGKQGAKAAIDASDVVLLQDNVEMITALMAKAKKAVGIVRQNVAFAFLAIALATVAAFLGYIPLWIAVVIHEGGTVLVALNALRLLKNE